MPLRLPRRHARRERIGEHVAVPVQALKETRRPHDVVGACQRASAMFARHRVALARKPHRARAGSTVRRSLPYSIAPRRVERVGHGVDERRNLFEQRARLLEKRRRTADGVGRHLHERIVPRQAGLISRRVVEPPWLRGFRARAAATPRSAAHSNFTASSSPFTARRAASLAPSIVARSVWVRT